MKAGFLIATIVGLALTPWAIAGQAPAGATGQCKDGTYTTAKTKQGACKGHQGVQTWFANSSSSSSAPASTATTSGTSSTPTPTAAAAPTAPTQSAPPATPAKTATKTAAAGGGPGLVWLNTSSNVYHCYGTANYGTTKAGKYMTEADAKAAGGRPDHNKPCSK